MNDETVTEVLTNILELSKELVALLNYDDAMNFGKSYTTVADRLAAKTKCADLVNLAMTLWSKL